MTSKRHRLQVTEEYRALAENSPDIVDRFDRKFRHLYVNPAGLMLLNRTATQVIGKTIRQTGVPKPFCERWEERIRYVFKTARPLEVTDQFPGPEGIRYYESRCVPEYDAAGKVKYVLVISREITERKRAEVELRQREADLAEAQRVARIGSWTFRVHDGLVRWSLELFRIFDTKPAPGTNYATFLACVHPEDREKVQHVNRLAIRTGRAFNIDYRIIHRNGEVRVLREIGYARKNRSGKVVELFGTAQDVTEFKRIESELRRSHQELEQRVKERTAKLRTLASQVTQAEARERRRIAYILHEDLQQMLAGIRMRLEMIRAAELPPAARVDADWMSEHLVNAIELTRRLNLRLRPPVLYEFGLHAALEWLAEDMKTSLGLRVRITGKDPAARLSEELRAFAFAAASELLMNVHKHSGVKAARVRMNATGSGELELTVSDRGRGYDTTLPHLEHSFGLFSLRERAEALGGRLHIQSAPGQGTRVTLILPM